MITEDTVNYHVVAHASGLVSVGDKQIAIACGDYLVMDNVEHSLQAGAEGCTIATTSIPVEG